MSEQAVAVVVDKQEVIDTISDAIAFAGTAVKDLTQLATAEVIATELATFQENATSALDQAERLVITNNNQFGTAGDLMKAVNAQIKNVEESRKKRTTQIDNWKKTFMKLFEPATNTLVAAKGSIQAKLNAWGIAEQERIRAEQKKAQQEQEERALALAQAQSNLGDQKGADQIIDEAAAVITKAAPERVVVRGSWGSTTSSRRVYDGTVTNYREFLQWVMEKQPDMLLDLVEFRKSGINKIAKEFDGKPVPGFNNTSRDDFGSR